MKNPFESFEKLQEALASLEWIEEDVNRDNIVKRWTATFGPLDLVVTKSRFAWNYRACHRNKQFSNCDYLMLDKSFEDAKAQVYSLALKILLTRFDELR